MYLTLIGRELYVSKQGSKTLINPRARLRRAACIVVKMCAAHCRIFAGKKDLYDTQHFNVTKS